MVVQFNLLPDVKLEYIKAERQKRVVVSVAIISSIVALCFLAFFVLTVRVFQQTYMNQLGTKVTNKTDELKEVKDLDKMLTVQSQLSSLDGLHAQKPVTSRLFSYLSLLTPDNASISAVKVDYSTNTLEISGKVPSLASVQKFADTLKFTTYKPSGKKASDKSADPAAFAGVVLTNFNRQKDDAQYTLKMSFDPALFSSSQPATLSVPSIDTTDPSHTRPTALFQPAVTEGQ